MNGFTLTVLDLAQETKRQVLVLPRLSQNTIIMPCIIFIRESVGSLCKDGADTPIVRVHSKAV